MKFTKIWARFIDSGRASVEEIRHEKIVFPRRVRETSVERSRSKSRICIVLRTWRTSMKTVEGFRGPRRNSPSSTPIEDIYLPKFRMWRFTDEDIHCDAEKRKYISSSVGLYSV